MNIRIFAFFLVLGVAVLSWIATCAAWQLDEVSAGVVPLDPQRYDRFTMVAVGTGGTYENPNRAGPCLAFGLGDELVLVDAGRDTAAALRAARIPASQPGTVYLTNLLPEHTVGLFDLLVSGWLDGRETPLELVGPPGTRAFAERLLAAHGPELRLQAEAMALPLEGARIEARELATGAGGSHGELSVTSLLLPGGPAPTLAYRFEGGGRAIVTSPVGWGREALVELARGAQMLVRDAVFVPGPELAEELQIQVDPERLKREAALQTSIEEVGGVARKAGVPTLVLVRLRPPPVYDLQITSVVGNQFDGRIVLPEDGDELRP
jgi:ribonuclease BN (tRNA processing enzyme)